ncbi:hypothetical protein FGB62_169g43 [Gracilaria domingensis]|nr:hypothetical protein FGB62_169g43 [Gracilaria domingensis]
MHLYYSISVSRLLSSAPQYRLADGTILPTLRELAGKSPRTNAELFVRLPWFYAHGIHDRDAILAYVDHARLLPGRLPMQAVFSRDWTRRIVAQPDALNVAGRLETNPRDFMNLVYNRIGRTSCGLLIPARQDMDTWAYRTEGEIAYVDALRDAIVNGDFPSGSRLQPASRMLLWNSLILPENFESRSEANTAKSYWGGLRFERRCRNHTGCFIAYQMVEVNEFRRDNLDRRYVLVPSWFSEYEVPIDMRVELPPVVTYQGFELVQNPRSGLSALFLSEWVALVAKRFLWDAAQSRLRVIPKALLRDIEDMNLSFVLSGKRRYRELLRCVSQHDDVDWRRVPESRAPTIRRNERASNYSPGRGYDDGTHTSGTWVKFSWETMLVAEAEFLREGANRVPWNDQGGPDQEHGTIPPQHETGLASPALLHDAEDPMGEVDLTNAE